MQDIMGITHYASGETEIFTDPAKFIETIREELPTRSTTGFTYKMVNADPYTRKAIDDLVYNEYGEENPHDLSYYWNTEGWERTADNGGTQHCSLSENVWPNRKPTGTGF